MSKQIPITRKQAINQMCRTCTADSLDLGSWRQQVTACQVYSCPLRPFRPISSQPLSEVLTRHWGLDETPTLLDGVYVRKTAKKAPEAG